MALFGDYFTCSDFGIVYYIFEIEEYVFFINYIFRIIVGIMVGILEKWSLFF